MCRTRSLILLLLLVNLASCRYGFVPEGARGVKDVALDPTVNRTPLREAGMVLDAHLEQAFSDMGMIASGKPYHRLSCSIVSAWRERTTSGSLASTDRYRLFIRVLAKLSDGAGKVVWQETFSDQGTFSEGGQDEDALEETCRLVSLQIARAVAAWEP